MATIIEQIDRPPEEVVEGFRELLGYESVTCAVSDCMGRFTDLSTDI